jgi:predicted HTH transcriptional regulator
MTEEKFLELLTEPESSILDFKADLYDFSNDREGTVLGKFVKDVISFTNTIRETSAYIIFGIRELPDSTKEKVGISKHIDDAILQDKIQSTCLPNK